MATSSSAPMRVAALAATALLLAGPSAILAVATPAKVVSVGCSTTALVAAIKVANKTPAADTIALKAGCTYTLTKGAFSDGRGPNGLPIVTAPLTIRGNGATIARASTAPAFRFFEVRGVHGSRGVLRLESLTLRGGKTPDTANGRPAENGGAIAVTAGVLSLTGTTFIGNTAGKGGDAGASAIDGGTGGNGGAISAQYESTLTVTRSTFNGNSAGRGGDGTRSGGPGGEGGAIFVHYSKPAQVLGCTFTANVAGDGGSGSPAGGGGGRGGAIYSGTALSVSESRFTSNRAGAAASEWPEGGGFGTGGAISAWAALTVANSTFTGNSAFQAGAIWSIHPDNLEFAIDREGTVVSGSTFSGNTAASVGGAVILLSGTLSVTNSTFTGNRGGTGGAIVNDNGTANVTNSTVLGNSVSGDGGGIHTSGTTTLRNTIVAGNTSSGSGTASSANCGGEDDATLLDGGGNLRWPESDTSCVGSYGDPQLLPLADNGGPTQTMGLGVGSAAIDAGVDATCVAPVGPPGYGAGGTDQRGFARPKGLHCDAGAVEYIPLHHLVLAPGAVTIDAGVSQAYTVEGRGPAGEDLGDVTSATTFSIVPDGSCTASTCTARVPGVHTVTGTDGAATGTATLTVRKLNQAITFGPLADATMAQSPLTLAGSASSGLAVAFSTTTPLVCTSSGPNGATVTLLRAGTCSVKADQAGNATYNPAPTVARSFTVR